MGITRSGPVEANRGWIRARVWAARIARGDNRRMISYNSTSNRHGLYIKHKVVMSMQQLSFTFNVFVPSVCTTVISGCNYYTVFEKKSTVFYIYAGNVIKYLATFEINSKLYSTVYRKFAVKR